MSNLELSKAIRLDQKVIELMPSLSRGFASKLIEDGKVSVNSQVITKPGQKLRELDDVVVDYDLSELDKIPSIEIPVIYEDDDCVVINKPVGLLTHSKGAFNPEATVATWLSSRYSGVWGERAGIVHRLDRATSGVMIGAKNAEASIWLHKQFSKRNVKKTYTAIITGLPDPLEAVIDMPIERNPKVPARFRASTTGKPAITHYKVAETSKLYTRLELKPETGRTHQLRVHLAQIGWPIVGDTFYDGQPANRLYLHAHELEITLLSRRRATFTAEVPRDFSQKMRQV